MKRVLTAVVFVALLLVGGQAFAQMPNQSGFGVGIGQSNLAGGISLKSASGATSYQFVVGGWRGYWFNDRLGRYSDGLAVSFDFLLEQPAIAQAEPFNLGWNFGLGGGVGFDFDAGRDDDFGFGVNGVLGLEFNFNPVPIDFTIEYRPGLFIYHDEFENDLDLFVGFFDLGAHLRFWF